MIDWSFSEYLDCKNLECLILKFWRFLRNVPYKKSNKIYNGHVMPRRRQNMSPLRFVRSFFVRLTIVLHENVCNSSSAIKNSIPWSILVHELRPKMLLVNEIARFLKVHPNFQDKMEMWSWFFYVGRCPQRDRNDLYILNKGN